MTTKPFLLDGWKVNPASGEVSRGKESQRLEPQVMKVLAYLAERPGTVIPREEFLDNLWGSAFVGDAALTRCIYEIRAAFGDNPREPRIVETVPKIGFRLIAKPEAPRAKITFNRPLMTWATAASLVLMAFVLPTASIVETDEPIVSQSPALATYYKARKYLVEPTRIASEAMLSDETTYRMFPPFSSVLSLLLTVNAAISDGLTHG